MLRCGKFARPAHHHNTTAHAVAEPLLDPRPPLSLDDEIHDFEGILFFAHDLIILSVSSPFFFFFFFTYYILFCLHLLIITKCKSLYIYIYISVHREGAYAKGRTFVHMTEQQSKYNMMRTHTPAAPSARWWQQCMSIEREEQREREREREKARHTTVPPVFASYVAPPTATSVQSGINTHCALTIGTLTPEHEAHAHSRT